MREPVITPRRGWLMLLHGTLMAIATTTGFWLTYDAEGDSLERARTVAFCVLAFEQLFFAFGCRSQTLTLPQLGFFSNPALFLAAGVSAILQVSTIVFPFAHGIFETTYLTRGDWVLAIGLALGPVTVIEITKLVRAGLSTRPEAAQQRNIP
jgi:Ca2+-transporting ATPase